MRDAEVRACGRHERVQRARAKLHARRLELCQARLLPLGKHDLTDCHRASEQLRERTQRERDAGKARACLRSGAARGETPHIWQMRSERKRCGLRPLTAQVGVI